MPQQAFPACCHLFPRRAFINAQEDANMIAEFTLLDGNPITINMGQIDCFQPCDDHTLIVFADGRVLTVHEPYDAVAEVLNPERQAGD